GSVQNGEGNIIQILSSGNSTAAVIKCDDSGLFSSYSICSPGVCCSNIPVGISDSLLFLTVERTRKTFLVSRSSSPTTQRVEPAQEKLCE
ncbi:hypothetical protein PENTCL1PPCAC_23959, partial [Pristionchus entomophagus]